MSTNMGNLEKLGILVIVILVVVVGVVAITPKATVDERLMPDGQASTEMAKAPEMLEPIPGAPPGGDVKAPQDPWPKDGVPSGEQKKLPSDALTADPTAKPATVLGSATPAAPDAASGFRTIKIRANDTLAMIAKRELGSATRYPEILKANPGLVATKLHKDQEIKIPVASAKPPADEKTANVPLAQPQPAAGSTETPAPATDKMYVVRSGDTLSAIAGREMGSKGKWTQLQKANEDVLHGSTALKIGMKLHIPAGEKSSTSTSDPAPAASGSETPSAAGTGHEYIVKSGDSLWLIAKNELGSEKLLTALRDANSDVLGGSDSLKVGMRLKLPASK